MKQLFLVILTVVLVVGVTTEAAAQRFDLPEPFATESSRNSASMIDRPAGSGIQLPEGFEVEVFASDFEGPRTMVAAPNGDLFVAQSRAGSVIVLTDTNNDGRPDARSTFADGLRGVFGIAFHDDYVYFGVTDRLVRFAYEDGDTSARGAEEKLADLEAGGHSTRDLVFNRAGTKLYVAVGSMSNKSDGEPETRAAINEFNPDGTGHRVFASGIRNPVALTLQPGTDTIWTAVNERDTLGDNLVPDYITSVQDGGFYGWPYSYMGSNPDPEHVGKRPDLVERALVPDVMIQAHSAAVGVKFYEGTQFPERYRNGAFVALHGSWNRRTPTGYKVGFVPFENGSPASGLEDFMTGWLNEGEATTWGRPVGLLELPDGSLLVSDDGGHIIWRVSYTGG
jgi:glucose/arabinose dehydrogenase